MKYSRLWKWGALGFLTVCMLIPGGYQSQARSQTREAPKVIWLLQEQIKPTAIDAFQKLQQRYIDIYTKAKFTHPWLGLAPIADKNSEVVFFWGFPSLSAMEGVFKETNRIHAGPFGPQLRQLDREATNIVTGQRESVATLRQDLSVRSDAAIGALRTGGFLQVLTVRLQPGKEQEWVSAMADSVAALNRVSGAQQSITYQVTSGDAPGTFLVMYPSTSPDDFHNLSERSLSALGAERAQRLTKVISETVQREEKTLYSIDPKMSFPR